MTTTRRRWCLALAIVLLTTACDYDVHLTTPTTPTPIATTTTATKDDLVEFRVSGTVPIVTVRVNNSLDGLSQVTTVLPFSSQLNITGRNTVFLSLEAQGTGTGFIHAAIFVNGVIFRESSSAAVFNPIITVNGTYRR